jgi:hypothetical protein
MIGFHQGEQAMSKDVINVKGEDVVVREDTAKAYRGVNWMIASLIGFVVIVAIVAAVFLLRAGSDGDIKPPTQTESRP